MENIEKKIESALDTVRPYLEADGGNVLLKEVTDEGIAILELTGSCGSCPMSKMTFKAGLQDAILKNVPEVKGVIALNLQE